MGRYEGGGGGIWGGGRTFGCDARVFSLAPTWMVERQRRRMVDGNILLHIIIARNIYIIIIGSTRF